jgi:acetylornithine/N-succinyldiaminopimelate aminotransferase
VSAAENVIRVLPPLTVSDEELSDGISRLSRAFTTLSKAKKS